MYPCCQSWRRHGESDHDCTWACIYDVEKELGTCLSDILYQPEKLTDCMPIIANYLNGCHLVIKPLMFTKLRIIFGHRTQFPIAIVQPKVYR